MYLVHGKDKTISNIWLIYIITIIHVIKYSCNSTVTMSQMFVLTKILFWVSINEHGGEY